MATARNNGGDGARSARLKLCLYVAGAAPNSSRALANLNALCREVLDGGAAVEVVDVLEQPLRALEDGILVTPTLVKLTPKPTATMVGDLSERSAVLFALGVAAEGA